LEKINTYINILDKKLNGGFLKGSSFLLYGEPGIGKTIFSIQLLLNQALNNDISILVSCDNSTNSIKLMLNTYWKNIISEINYNKFIIVDSYSWRLSRILNPNQISVQNLSDFFSNLIDTIEKINNTQNKMPTMIVVDSITTIIEYNGINATSKFLQTLSAINNEWEMVIFFIMEEGVHNVQEMKKIEYILDGLIYLYKKKYQTRYLEIPHIRFSNPIGPIEYSIDNNGFHFIE